jgi:hypothetical protein
MSHSKINAVDIGVLTQFGYPANATADTDITMDSLKEWVKEKDFHTPFFASPDEGAIQPYLDQSHPHYSKKLRAAIEAWIALQDDPIETAVKQKIIKWLKPRAAEYGLLHEKDDPMGNYSKGDTNKTAIEEVAKLINWNEKGGAGTTSL